MDGISLGMIGPSACLPVAGETVGEFSGGRSARVQASWKTYKRGSRGASDSSAEFSRKYTVPEAFGSIRKKILSGRFVRDGCVGGPGWVVPIANCDYRSGRRRAIALLLPALILGAIGGLPCVPSSSHQPPLAASPSRYEAARGGSRDDVEPAQYVPRSETNPARDPPPAADAVESEAPFSLAEAIAYGLRHNPRLQQISAQVAAGREGAEIAFCTLLARVRARFGFSGFDAGRITPQEKTIVMTLLFIASCPSCRNREGTHSQSLVEKVTMGKSGCRCVLETRPTIGCLRGNRFQCRVRGGFQARLDRAA
jgi:hypothetical protein